MNKYTILLLLLLITVLSSMAQKQPKLPEFGDVSKSELEMKECSFEKNATAMVVFGKGTSVYVFRMATDDYIETEYHYRIKIFNKKGFHHANIKIPYPNVSSGMGIKGVKAQTYNLDAAGNIVVSKVEKATIYDKKINQYYSEKTFALPDIKEGSIIEYTFTIENGYSNVWNFQWTIPVMTSMFVIDFSNEFEIRTIPNVSMPLRQWTVSKSNNNISYYVMEQIPSLDNEPYMSCTKDYLQRMEFVLASVTIPGRMPYQYLHDWPWVVKALMDNDGFGGQLKKEIPRTSELDEMLKGMSDPYKKMVAIHNYVRNNMEWDKDYSIWASDGVKNAWRNKKGSTGEINMIMINLMRDAGLVAHPVLVSTRQNGIINTGVPSVDNFDKVLAYVEIGDKKYVLDATDKITPAYLIPLEVSASEGLVIEKFSTFEWGWKPLWDGDHSDYTNVFFTGEITDKHVLSCGAEITAYDYAKVKIAPTVKLGKEAMKSNLTSVPDVKVDSIEVLNASVDTLPLVEKFNFTMPTTATGDYHYFSINLFGGLEKNPFYADQRQTDIFFGVKRSYKINASIYLPEGYEMDEMPKNIKMITPDTGMVFTRMSYFKDGLLTVRADLDFKSPIYEVGNYEAFKEFYKKLFGMLNERYVYKKAGK
jgi:Domain of Unknown Function with PDB structure (DUF3857)/Transglutaminase-like superfamily